MKTPKNSTSKRHTIQSDAAFIPPQNAMQNDDEATPTTVMETPIVRIQLIRERTLETPVGDFSPVPAVIRGLLEDADREKLIVLHMETQTTVLSAESVALGALNVIYVQPREVFKGAFLSNASAIILAHSHPGGEVFPSQEDLVMTKRLIKAGELLELPVWDHYILGGSGRRKLISLRDTTALWDS